MKLELIQKLGVIGLIFSVIFWISLTALLVKGCNEVQEKGLKAVIEEIWEAPVENQKNIVGNKV